MQNSECLSAAIIGGGPRGTSVLERLVAGWSGIRRPPGFRLKIHLVDPWPPGPGRVWRPEQPRRFLMNTPSLFPTVVPVGAAAEGIPASPVGLSFDGWRELMVREPATGLSADDRIELRCLGAADFPSRALYGRYLTWVHAQVLANRGGGVDVVHHAAEVTALRSVGTGYRLELSDGTELEVDSAVLALGHLSARLSPEQAGLRDGAERYGLQYLPPAVPADVDWSRLAPREPVLVRGLGLNFFDVMIELTEGRGGRFRSSGGDLVYEPSGTEPVIVAASRRGVPYRAKARLDSYVPRGVALRYCTAEALSVFGAEGIQPGFDHDIWPLLHRDVLWTYYSTLARVSPASLLAPAEQLLAGVSAALEVTGAGWLGTLSAVLGTAVPAGLQLDVEALAHPFSGRRFPTAADFRHAVLTYLEEDTAGSARGEEDPLKMAIGALNAGRSVIKQAVADGGLTDASWMAELRGWFEPLVEGAASGPPALRIAQLSALMRARVVELAGPDPTFTLDAGTGQFKLASPWVGGTEFRATCLVEAMMPSASVSLSQSPLMVQLLGEGMVRPRLMMPEDGIPVVSPGLDVTVPPYRPVGANGEPRANLYVLGLQLASVQWGTAIAAEAGARLSGNGRTLRDANDIAQAILAGAPGSTSVSRPV